MLWLAAQTYLLCLASFIAGVVLTALILRNRRPAEAREVPEAHEAPEEPETAQLPVREDQPESMIIKAARKSMRYHTPDSPYYNRLKGDVIFESIEEAEKAGYSAWKTPARA